MGFNTVLNLVDSARKLLGSDFITAEELWKKRQNKVLIEPLEPRVLLSSDLTYTAADGKAVDLTLRMQKVNEVDTLQLVNNGNQSVLRSQAVADTSAVVIQGADQSDKLIVDFSNPFSIPISFTDTSETDSDVLKVIGRDNTWNITGSDTGNVGGVNFSGIEKPDWRYQS
jgi:hypothetical protein